MSGVRQNTRHDGELKRNVRFSLIKKNKSTPHFTAALYTIAVTWKQPEWPSVDEWTKKMRHIQTTQYHSVIKKKDSLLFATTWMDLEGTMLREMSDGERQIPYDFTCMWNLKQVNWKSVTDNIKTKSQMQRANKWLLEKRRGWKEKWNTWGRSRATNFQLQNKWVTGWSVQHREYSQ